jgi:hypothetical protein
MGKIKLEFFLRHAFCCLLPQLRSATTVLLILQREESKRTEAVSLLVIKHSLLVVIRYQ